MIGYVMYGTNDMDKAAAFYDQLLSNLGAKRVYEDDRSIAWGVDPNRPAISITRPWHGQRQSPCVFACAYCDRG